MIQEKRISKWDNVKAVMIICVILGHFSDMLIPNPLVTNTTTMQNIYLYIYSFHMPVFFFLSGLFQKKYTHERKLKSDRLFFYIIIGFLLKGLLYFISTIMDYPVDCRVFSLLSDQNIPWFPFSLASIIFLTYLVKKIKPAIVIPCSIIIICLTGYCDKIGDFLYLSRTLVFFPFYYIGYCIDEHQFYDFLKRKLVILLSIVILFTFAVICFYQLDNIYWLRGLFTGRNSFPAIILIENCGFVHRLISYGISLLMGISVMAIVPNYNLKIISYIGTKTLAIFFWHLPFLWIIERYYIQPLLPANISFFLLLSISILLAIFLSIPVWNLPLKLITKFCSFKRHTT